MTQNVDETSKIL